MFKFRYKTKYSNSFLSTLIVFFVAFFVSLWLYFFIHPQLTIVAFGFVILFLLYWNFNTEGKIIFDLKAAVKTIEIKGQIQAKYEIEKIYFGWNYAFVNHGRSTNLIYPTMVMSSNDSRPTSNTVQCIVLLKLNNGDHITLIKELKPWSETRDLEYIGHLTDKINMKHQLYIRGNFWRFRKLNK